MAQDRKQALTQFHRQTIIDAAGRLFLKTGVSGTTMEDIAKESGYSKSTVYVYFSSKTEINNALACHAMALLNERIIEAIASREGFHEQFEAISAALLIYQRDHPYYFQRLTDTIDYSVDPQEKTPWLYEAFVVGEELNTTVRDFVRRGMDLKLLREEPSLVKTQMVFWFAISGLMQVSANKKTYIADSLTISQEEFLEYGLRVMLRAFEESGAS